MIFGDRNVKTIIVRELKQLLVGTCTPTGRGRIISEKKNTDKPEIGLEKKTDQPRGTKVDVCEEKMGGRAGG